MMCTKELNRGKQSSLDTLLKHETESDALNYNSISLGALVCFRTFLKWRLSHEIF